MEWIKRRSLFVVAVLAAASGCATWTRPSADPAIDNFYKPEPSEKNAPTTPRQGIIQAGFASEAIPHSEHPGNPASDSVVLPFHGRAELNADDVVRAVLERSPTLDQMRAAASAAAARFPQVTSLDDPMFALTTAPGSAGSNTTSYAARAEVSQKFLYPGKRALKGMNAQAEAAAATEDVNVARLLLAEAARSAFADYFLAMKEAEVSGENETLLTEFRKNAETRYRTGVAPQQDVLQAEVELARVEERLVSLRRAKQVAIARINTLMHLPPETPVPTPSGVKLADAAPDPVALRAIAAARPDLRAVANRVAAEEATLALAMKEYKPDVEVLAAYDGFWQGESGRPTYPLQFQVGLRTNLPVRYGRRGGAVAEAQAKLAQRRAELARLSDKVNFEVQEAVEQVRESEDVVRLYEAKILPAARANVKEAQSGYVNGKVPFLNLVEAQRNQFGLKDRYFEVLAETVRRRAALERAVGGSTSMP